MSQFARTFHLWRGHDQSGVSGIGVVLYGAVFPSGKCVIQWRTPTPGGSLNIFDSFEQFKAIHVDPHPENKSEIVWSASSRPTT